MLQIFCYGNLRKMTFVNWDLLRPFGSLIYCNPNIKYGSIWKLSKGSLILLLNSTNILCEEAYINWSFSNQYLPAKWQSKSTIQLGLRKEFQTLQRWKLKWSSFVRLAPKIASKCGKASLQKAKLQLPMIGPKFRPEKKGHLKKTKKNTHRDLRTNFSAIKASPVSPTAKKNIIMMIIPGAMNSVKLGDGEP